MFYRKRIAELERRVDALEQKVESNIIAISLQNEEIDILLKLFRKIEANQQRSNFKSKNGKEKTNATK